MRPRLYVPLIVLCAIFAVASVPANASWASIGHSLLRTFDRVDVVRHDMTAWIDPAAGTARFEDDVRIVFERSANHFHMLLGNNVSLDEVVDPLTGQSLSVSAVLRWNSLPFVIYRVNLPNRVARGSLHTYRFKWHLPRDDGAMPDQRDPLDPFVSPQFFYAGYPSMWYPQTPSEDFFDARITLHLPTGYRGFTEGRVVEHDDSRNVIAYETEFPTDKLGLGVGRFYVEEVMLSRDSRLELWRPMGRSSVVHQIGTYVAGTMDYLEEKLGSLPIQTHRIVEIPFVFPASYVSLSTLVYGGDLRFLGLDTESAQTILAAHETAHKWLGGVAGVPPVGSAWFVEGASEYLGYLALTEILPPEQAKHVFRDRVIGPFIFAYGPEQSNKPRRLGSIEVFDDDSFVIFSKGTLVFRMLHRRLGDARFFDAIKTFVDEYEGRHGKASDFESIVQRLAPPGEARELDRFFRDWIRGTEVLDYALEVESLVPSVDGAEGAYELTYRVVSKGRLVEPEEADVEILLSNGIRRIEKVPLNTITTVLLPRRPIVVQLDPDYWLADANSGNNIWMPGQ